MEGYFNVLRKLLDQLPPAGASLSHQGLLIQLHCRANPRTAIYRTTARRLAEETGGRIEHVRSILQDLRRMGLVIYAADHSNHLRPLFMTHFILSDRPLRMTRPWPQILMLAQKDMPELRKLHLTQTHSQTDPDVNKLSCEYVENYVSAYMLNVGDAWVYSHRELFSMRIDTDITGEWRRIIEISDLPAQSRTQSCTQTRPSEELVF
jgi:hypothetical protein